MGGSIAFPSLLPFLILLVFEVFVLNCIWDYCFFFLFYGCMKVRFPDVEENPGPGTQPCDKCRIMFSNINGLNGNLEDLAVAASGLDIVVCAETKVSGRRPVAELLILGFHLLRCS